jgi:hypothetical protein
MLLTCSQSFADDTAFASALLFVIKHGLCHTMHAAPDSGLYSLSHIR